MTTGSQSDIANRASQILPPSWFPTPAANKSALLQGFANIMSWAYSLIAFAKLQMRISTATGFFLDLIAFDFFGRAFMRRVGQSDSSFAIGIKKELLRARATRPGMVQALVDLTGIPPTIFEPTKPSDTGGYGYQVGYSVGGGYGSMLMPFQCLMTAYRPATSGIAYAPGYGVTSTAAGSSLGGYGAAGEYGDLSFVTGAVTDAQIYARVASVAAIGTVPWTQLLSAVPPAPRAPYRLAAEEQGAATDYGNCLSSPVEFADLGNCTSGISLIINLGIGA